MRQNPQTAVIQLGSVETLLASHPGPAELIPFKLLFETERWAIGSAFRRAQSRPNRSLNSARHLLVGPRQPLRPLLNERIYFESAQVYSTTSTKIISSNLGRNNHVTLSVQFRTKFSISNLCISRHTCGSVTLWTPNVAEPVVRAARILP